MKGDNNNWCTKLHLKIPPGLKAVILEDFNIPLSSIDSSSKQKNCTHICKCKNDTC
jgi:hypothetical protein